MRRFTLIAASAVFAFCALPVQADEVKVSPNPETFFVIASVQPTANPQADVTDDFAPNRRDGSKSAGAESMEPTGNSLGPIESYFYNVSLSRFDFGLHRTAAASDGVFELGFGEFVPDVENRGPEAFSGGSGASRGSAGGGMQFAPRSGDMTAGHMFAGPQLPLGNGMFLSFPEASPFATVADGTNDRADSHRFGTHSLRHGRHEKDSEGDGGSGDPPPSNLPEPATMLLTGAGLLGLALKRRR